MGVRNCAPGLLRAPRPASIGSRSGLAPRGAGSGNPRACPRAPPPRAAVPGTRVLIVVVIQERIQNTGFVRCWSSYVVFSCGYHHPLSGLSLRIITADHRSIAVSRAISHGTRSRHQACLLPYVYSHPQQAAPSGAEEEQEQPPPRLLALGCCTASPSWLLHSLCLGMKYVGTS